jgi:hypothetical protein
MLNLRWLPCLAGFGLLLTTSLTASAGFTVYSNRAAFEAAVAGTLTSENFNSVVTDRSFQLADGAKSIGPLTFTETGPSTAGTGNGKPNQIDASAFESSGIFSGNGTSYVYLAIDASDTAASIYGVNLTFSSPVSAFGGDFTKFVSASSPSEDFRLNLLSATTPGSFLLPTPASTGTFFFGIVADPGDRFGGIAFSGETPIPSRRGTAGLDNVAVVLVPEPSTALLGGVAILCLATRRRPCSTTR